MIVAIIIMVRTTHIPISLLPPDDVSQLIKTKDNRGRTVFHHLARAPCTLYSDVLPCFELIEKRLSSQSGENKKERMNE